jgi:predicted ArsR family transcriptional regulator
MEGTRLRIVALLQQSPQATVEELAQAVGMASASIRRHLDILQRDRLVAYRTIRRKPGRPEHAFYLTDAGQEALPKRYQQLLHRFLQALGSLDGAAPQGFRTQLLEQLLSRVAHLITEPYRQRLSSSAPGERVELLRELLEAEEFAPSAEEVPGGLRIHLLNCPFRGVAMQNPAICLLDQEIIGHLLGAAPSVEGRINQNQHHHHCIYTIALTR